MAYERARARVIVDGEDVSLRFRRLLISMTISKTRKPESDTADVELDDRVAELPPKGSRVVISIARRGSPFIERFRGKTDEPRSAGGRNGGRVLRVHAKASDMGGALKERRSKDWTDQKLGRILEEAGKEAELSRVIVAPEYADLHRTFEDMDNESFPAFGRRIAREIGATFKIEDDLAVFAVPNRGMSATGQALPIVPITYGDNLLDWDIVPTIARPAHRKHQASWFDRQTASWRREEREGAGERATRRAGAARANGAEASEETGAGAAGEESSAGKGSISCLGDTRLQPEGFVTLAGARRGVDGRYVVDSMRETVDRSGGYGASLEVEAPGEGAGKTGADG